MLGIGVDWRSDLFAVGATLYEMLTGHLPFEGFDRTARPISLRDFTPGVPEMIDKMVLQALDPDPDKRFQSAAEFLVPIKRVLFAVEKATRGSAPTAVEPSQPATAEKAAEARATAPAPSFEPAPSFAPPPESEPAVPAAPSPIAPIAPVAIAPAVVAAAPEDLPVPEESIADTGFIDFGAPGLTPAPARVVQATVTYDPYGGLDADERAAIPLRPAPPAGAASTKKTETGIIHPMIDPATGEFDPRRS